jgi:hypothetical protein
MAMAVTGGVHDHKMIMDFLPNALFPKDERRIVAYMSTGFSMGGEFREHGRVALEGERWGCCARS